MKKIFFTLLIIVSFLTSCKKEGNSFLGDLLIIDSFEREFTIDGCFFTEIDSLGVLDTHFFQPYILQELYSQAFLLRIYDQDSFHYLGEYIRHGQGPDDFLALGILKQPQTISNLICQDYASRKIRFIDLKEVIRNEGKHIIKKELNYKDIEEPFTAFYDSDSCLYIKSLQTEKGLILIKYNPLTLEIEKEYELYTEIIKRDDINKIMSLADFYEPNHNKIVIVTGKLNQIDILSLNEKEKSFSVQ